MELFFNKGLKAYIIFIGVFILYTPVVSANFNFSKMGLRKGQGFHKTPKNDAEKNLNLCVQDLCGSFDPQRTYKFYTNQIAINTAKSRFFQDSIAPLFEQERDKADLLLDEVEFFAQKLATVQSDIQLKPRHRRSLAFFEAVKLLKNPYFLPIQQHLVNLGPLNTPTSLEYYLGSKFDEYRFERSMEYGIFRKKDRQILQSYIEYRDLNFVIPFIGENSITSVINTHGKGAKDLFLGAYKQISYFYNNQRVFDVIDKNFILPIKHRDEEIFLKNQFDTIVKMKSLGSYDYGFSENIVKFGLLMEFARTTQRLITPTIFPTPKVILQEKLIDLSERLLQRVQKQRKHIKAEAFRERISNQCQWKINYLYEGLPTEEEIERAKQHITKSIVKFQSWLFENMSPETATSIFDFLRAWGFFYPPTKSEFKKFITAFIELDRKTWFFAEGMDALPVIAQTLISQLEDEWPENYHGLNKLEQFCKSLSINPLGDNANTYSGQVHLGWMALKDERLLETVVWHELGHIMASLITRDYKGNFIRTMLGKAQDFKVSLESFTKYMTANKCLGSNQQQKMSFKSLGEPYVSWFNKGQLVQFSGKGPPEDGKVNVHPQKLNIGEMKSHTNVSLFAEFGPKGHFLDKQKKVLRDILTVSWGEFIDEDWADLIAASIAKNNANPFCFILKGQDHLFWNEKKGLANHEIPSIIALNLNESAHPLSEDEKDRINASTEKHSTLFYRLLHVETVRSGFLPPSCQQAQKLKPELSTIKKCDYF